MQITNGELTGLDPGSPHFDMLARATRPGFTIDDARRSRALTLLVQTLANALDVREIFSQLSVAARAIVHRDEAVLALFDESGARLRVLRRSVRRIA